MAESCYASMQARDGELVHHYGEHVHLMADPLALTWLSRLGHPDCVQPEINRIVTMLYRGLVREVIDRVFPRRIERIETRMSAYNDKGFYEGTVIDPTTEVTTVDIARAGILPSMVCFEAMTEVLEPSRVRQDHVLMNRLTDAQDRVTGAGLFGKKIAGPVEGRYVLFPDPMGATGSSLVRTIEMYLNEIEGTPRRLLTLNLIVTPEFIRKLTDMFPGKVDIFAYRLDRGLSDDDVLATLPGTHWARECGLNDMQYIVPGAGGMGEIMNNALS